MNSTTCSYKKVYCIYHRTRAEIQAQIEEEVAAHARKKRSSSSKLQEGNHGDVKKERFDTARGLGLLEWADIESAKSLYGGTEHQIEMIMML